MLKQQGFRIYFLSKKKLFYQVELNQLQTVKYSLIYSSKKSIKLSINYIKKSLLLLKTPDIIVIYNGRILQASLLQSLLCGSAPTFDRGGFQPAADALHVSIRVLDLVDGLCTPQLHQVPQFHQGHPKLPVMVALGNRVSRVVSHSVGHVGVASLLTLASATAPMSVSEWWVTGNAASSAHGRRGGNGRLAPAQAQHAPRTLAFKEENEHFLLPAGGTQTGKRDSVQQQQVCLVLF